MGFVVVGGCFYFSYFLMVVTSSGCGYGFARLRAFVHPIPFL